MANLWGMRVYLIGGVVRDLLLGYPNLDLDLVVEGRAIPLARRLAEGGDWSLRTYPRFGTAKLRHGALSFDLVTARSETYICPGALPIVEPGTIMDDLARRDLSINAMAVHLDQSSFGEVIDPHGGQNDLKEGLVRVLHPKSFVDDPTRLIRAIRYEQRLGFRLEQKTHDLLQRDLAQLNTVTGERLWHELEAILDESCPELALNRADELGILKEIDPALKGDSWLAERFSQARSTPDESLSLRKIYLALMAMRFVEEEAERCITKLKMPGWAAHTVRATMRLEQALSALAEPDIRPSDIYHQLERYIPEVVKAAALVVPTTDLQQKLELYAVRLRHIKPKLSGNDLQSMGATPGRGLGRMLRILHDAWLNQEVKTREEEETLARSLLGGGVL